MQVQCRGVRGATTVEANTADAILSATRELLVEIIRVNGITEDEVASIFFTTTPDLTAEFPAKAARDLGWRRIALMGGIEMDVPHGVPLCVRVLIHWNTARGIDDIRHVYTKGALALRPDLFPDNRIEYDEREAARTPAHDGRG
jgi:chorismate mutase